MGTSQDLRLFGLKFKRLSVLIINYYAMMVKKVFIILFNKVKEIKMKNFNKVSLMIFFGAMVLAGCNEQSEDQVAKVEVSSTLEPAVVVPAPGTLKAPANVAAPVVVDPPKPYVATLEEGIDFRKPLYPTFIAEVSGMSSYEPTIRWTEGPLVKFRFKQPLPKIFTLEIAAISFGPNLGLPIKVRVGGVEKNFVIPKVPTKDSAAYKLTFKTDGKSDTLEIMPPKPTSPRELDPKSGDTRKLGIAFVSLKIKG